MLPSTAQMTPEAADIEDARKVRWGISPSYFLNLGHLSGNRFVGYNEIYPRMLYRFDWVYPNGINESSDRMDEDKAEMPAVVTTKRSPRTCAQDVTSEAAERVFVIFSSLTDREDAPEIWDAIYPVEVEARIWAATQRHMRGPVPDYLREFYAATGVEAPFIQEGHALQLFIDHLEKIAPQLILQAKFDEQAYGVAETALREILQGANEAYQFRYGRLHTSFGSMMSQRTSGKGKRKLDPHDWECLQETGIKREEDSENQLAAAVDRLAQGQQQTNKILEILLKEREERNATQS
jgi:hypothetical protein